MDTTILISMIIHGLSRKGKKDVASFLNRADSNELVGEHYDNWNGGTTYYSLVFYFDYDIFLRLDDNQKQAYQSQVYEVLCEFYPNENDIIQAVVFRASTRQYLTWIDIPKTIRKDDILESVTSEMQMLIDSGTGKIVIKDGTSNLRYKEIYQQNSEWLKKLGLKRSHEFEDLWKWHSYYSPSMPTYVSRRAFVHSVYDELIHKITKSVDLREQETENSTIEKLQETMSEVRDISQQAFEEFGRAIKTIQDAQDNLSDERARKDAVRSIASAMEAIVKSLGKTNDIKTSCRVLRDSSGWGPTEIVKEGDSLFSILHRIYPDLRHGSLETSAMSMAEATYWIERMISYVSYLRAKYSDSLRERIS